MNVILRGEGNSSPGQSLVEMTLVLTILVLIFAGLLDLGRALNAYIVITNAAREGARYGAAHPTDREGIQARVMAEAAGSGVDIPEDGIEVVPAFESGQPVTVSVTYQVSLILIAGGGSIPVRSSATMIAF